MIRNAFVCAVLSLTTLAACGPPHHAEPVQQSETETRKSFNATAAWDEFEDTVRLFYAYIDRSDFDVDAQLARSKKLAIAAETDSEFRRILHQTAYTFTDPHFIVGPFENDDYNIIPTSSDLKVEWQGERLVVLDVRLGSAAATAIEPNWFILKIGGQDPMTASRKPFGSVADNLTIKQLNYGANLAANGLRKGQRSLSVMTHQGETRDITLPSPREFAKNVSTWPAITTHPYDGTATESLNANLLGNFGYIKINNQLGNNALITDFDQTLATLMDTDGLILDLRNTPSGGNTEVARSIIGHFITETQSYQVHEIPSLEREFTVPRRFIEQVKPRAPYYGKPVVVIGGHWTGSMGEGLVIGMDAAADAYTITSNMGDLLGALRNYTLQNSSARIDFGSQALFHVDGTPREDYIGDLTLPGVDQSTGTSMPAIAAAREYLNNQKLLTPTK